MTQLKILVRSRSERENLLVGIASLKLNDFLDSEQLSYNNKERLTKCEDKQAFIAYQLVIEPTDGIDEKTKSKRESSPLTKYDGFTIGKK
jgi:hypothetical protein